MLISIKHFSLLVIVLLFNASCVFSDPQQRAPNNTNSENSTATTQTGNTEIPDLSYLANLSMLTDENFEATLAKFKTVLVIFVAKKDDFSPEDKVYNHLLESARSLIANEPSVYVAYAILSEVIKQSKYKPLDLNLNEKLNLVLYDFDTQFKLPFTTNEISTEKVHFYCKSRVITVADSEIFIGNMLEKTDYSQYVIFFDSPEKKEQLKVFRQVALDSDLIGKSVKFVITPAAETAEFFQQKAGNIWMKKHIDELEITTRYDFTPETLKTFILAHQIPMYNNQSKVDEVFAEGKPGIILFRDIENRKRGWAEDEFRTAYYNYYRKDNNILSKLVFMMVGYREEIDYTIADFARMQDDDVKVAIIDTREQDSLKWSTYIMEKEISAENIVEFIDKFWANKLEFSIVSEEIPIANSDPVKTIVGKTFKSQVIDSDKDVILMVWSPECYYCKHHKESFLHIHSEIAPLNEHIIFGYFDGSKNVVKDLIITNYPEIYYFKNGNKSSPVLFDGEKSVDKIIQFIKDNSSKPVRVVSVEKEKEDILDKISKLSAENKDQIDKEIEKNGNSNKGAETAETVETHRIETRNGDELEITEEKPKDEM